MTSNENSEIRGRNIENELTLVAFILVNRGISGIEKREQISKYRYGNISDRIKLFIGQLLASFVLTGNLRVCPRCLYDFCAEFFRHGNSIT